MAEVRLTRTLREINKNLFPDNSFIEKSRNDNSPDAKTVEYSETQSGTAVVTGTVQTDWDTPAQNLVAATGLTPVKRINTQRSYSNIIFRPESPVLFENLNEVELLYNKRQEVAEETAGSINTAIANYAAIQWAPEVEAFQVLTTGTATRTSDVTSGYAGLVKKIDVDDLIEVRKRFMKMNLNTGGSIYGLITPNMWADIMVIPDLVNFEKTGRETMLKQGIVGTWMGINFMLPRHNESTNANLTFDLSTYAVGTTAATKDAYGATPTATSSSTALFWNDKQVRKNKGNFKMFSEKDNPLYMADIVNWGIRFGATHSRTDGKGIVTLIEAQTV